MALVAFGELLADLPSLNNPGVLQASGVIPAPIGYKPFPGLVEYSAALDARCQGAASFRSSAGTIFTFASTATKLYTLDGTAWVDATRLSGGDYNVPASGFTSFAQFGDLIVTQNGADAPQKFDMASDADFSALGGTPPTAKYIGVVKNFVVMLNLTGFPQRAHWSAFEDPEDYVVAPSTTQCDFQDLLGDHGDIMGFVGGDVGTVFCERGIFRMEYVGPPEIFRFSRVEQARGCAAPASIVPLGWASFYLADDGFYMFDGQQSLPIGKDRIDASFYAEVDQNYIHRINAALDPVNALVLWSVPVAGNSGGNPNKVYVFNWKTPKWATAPMAVEWFWRDLTKGYTLDSLDNLSASLDALPFSLDDRSYAGGKIVLAAFNESHKLSYFGGAALAVVIDTGEAQLTPRQKTLVTEVWPQVQGSDVEISVALGFRDRLNDAVTWTSPVDQNAIGYCEFLNSAFFHRARLFLAAGGTWEFALGIDPGGEPNGMM